LFRLAAGWRRLRGAGQQRLALTAILLLAALLLARLSWFTYFTNEAERSLYDFRSFFNAELVEQDQRVALVVYTDQTLIALQKRSPLDRGMLARALRNIDGMGAKAIGIDILFDQPQAEDEDLITTLRAMRTPVSVGYTTTEANALDIIHEQQAYLDGFLARLEGSNARAASVKVSDSAGVVRTWPELDDSIPPLIGRSMLAAAADPAERAFRDYEGALRYRMPALLDRPVFPSFDIDIFANDELLAMPEVRAQFANQIAGRYVLIGGDIIGIDRVLTPFSTFDDDTSASGVTDPRPPGIEVHAATIAQMLDGVKMPKPSGAVLWVYAALVVLSAALTALLEMRSLRFIPLMLGQLALFIGLPFFLQAQGVDTYGFPAIGPILGWVLAFSAVVAAARAATATERQFARGALGKYLPREMAQQIIDNPELLALHGEKKEIFVVFSDLEGFTKMSHAIAPEMVAKLLNRYLEMLSQVVLDHGGVIDKFVGDAVVAFWGAPIAKPDDGMRAAKAGYAIWQAGEAFRAEVAAMDETLPKIGKTRVGLHWGEAVVGNFGGDTRIQYTALGDSMNTAARLESANKALQTSVMASREFAERSGLDWWRAMGRVVLSGRSQPVDLMEPAPDFPEADRAALAQAVAMLAQDQAEALERLAEIAARYPQDTGLAALLERSRDIDASGAHVLTSK